MACLMPVLPEHFLHRLGLGFQMSPFAMFFTISVVHNLPAWFY